MQSSSRFYLQKSHKSNSYVKDLTCLQRSILQDLYFKLDKAKFVLFVVLHAAVVSTAFHVEQLPWILGINLKFTNAAYSLSEIWTDFACLFSVRPVWLILSIIGFYIYSYLTFVFIQMCCAGYFHADNIYLSNRYNWPLLVLPYTKESNSRQ